MSEQQWREAASAELRGKLNAELDTTAEATEAERQARARREEAERRIADIRAAAAALEIDLGEDDEAIEEAAEVAGSKTARTIVLDDLRDVFPASRKAAELRTAIEDGLGRPVHYKTPGMTLYRLAEEGLVRREGHRWFAVMTEEEALMQ